MLHTGIDIGSTTTKVVVVDTVTGEILHGNYRRHHAKQAESVKAHLEDVARLFPGRRIRLAVTGSGGKVVADHLGVPYVQEVVANSLAIRKLHPEVRCAIELGGQDAKMIFLRKDSATGETVVSDMRMNGSCAGGTGAFIDEIATLLGIDIEDFDSFAELGTTVYEISGRCGVFAKTDIQPLLNQGVSKQDLALSTFHAIAKQTLGGLAQGLDIEAPVIFEGGPLTFNRTLVRVFIERLGITDEQAISPSHPETIVAYGAALSLDQLFADVEGDVDPAEAAASLADISLDVMAGDPPLFSSDEERDAFLSRLAAGDGAPPVEVEPGLVRAYLGIDSGSTTTKFALINEDEELLYEFYANNGGSPLDVARDALARMRDSFAEKGVELDIVAVGTTGYGEELFAKAFSADLHTVETVAHARAATKYVPDASFVLDIGGQDMKAIWLDRGVITNILVNEACSSGCGSFLENFASSLGFAVEDIEAAAFRSESPAALGSRCTVFMNSSIVTAQRSGKGPDDIMAGLCRSIIQNVFTKVVRIPNLDVLGKSVVVQGGTFKNAAVVRSLEQHVGATVRRAPYPGIMGAIGVALLAKEKAAAAEAEPFASTFIGLDAAAALTYERDANSVCPFCANHCHRTVITFPSGATHVTGNRCERGEVVGPMPGRGKDGEKGAAAVANEPWRDSAPNLFELRERLLFKSYEAAEPTCQRDITIGIPRVLEFWDNAPFWTTLFRSLGMRVRLSSKSTRKRFEASLSRITSDTLCFPAKLVHGHVRELAEHKVDRIFMPIVTTVPTENASKTSQWMCAVVKGYPMVVRNSDDPERAFGVPLDDPLFHWYDTSDRDRQLIRYLAESYGVGHVEARRAIEAADAAMGEFRRELEHAGAEVLSSLGEDETNEYGDFAIVLASRPYHNDALVNHDVPKMLAKMGIAVLPPDAVPGTDEVDLSNSRIDVVNNFHARMLATALIAARDSRLEYVQLVSFGCGHDAYLSDEICRMMDEVSGKTPLILKIDESDARGPLRIRLRSFVETSAARRARLENLKVGELKDPYQVKFSKRDKKIKTVLVPNTSHAFCRLMSAAFKNEGLKTEPLEMGREEAIALGKRYVHNDICFPAQITVGEALAALRSGKYDVDSVAVATGKYVGDCRLTHYAALLRKALDDAGYEQVPIITNDTADDHDMQPGYRMGLRASAEIAFGLPIIDALEMLLRKIRPYELVEGSTERAFEEGMDAVINGLERGGILGMRRGFSRAIDIMKKVRYDRSNPRPRVLIVGEYLLNFHPGANREIERYLENNGMEIVEAKMTDVIRKTYFYKNAQVKEFHVSLSPGERVLCAGADMLFERAHDMCDAIGKRHPLYEPAERMGDLVKASDDIVHHTFDAGEGVLIPAEILHNARKGCRTFVILQPFGCLPNHVVGRGISKRLKELYPDAQILPLDYDPDVSFANIENRLQMLIMSARDADEQEQG